MERIAMRTENELTMRNLRNLNQELQGQIKEVRSKQNVLNGQKIRIKSLSSSAMKKENRINHPPM